MISDVGSIYSVGSISIHLTTKYAIYFPVVRMYAYVPISYITSLPLKHDHLIYSKLNSCTTIIAIKGCSQAKVKPKDG